MIVHARSDLATATVTLTSTPKNRNPCAKLHPAGKTSGLATFIFDTLKPEPAIER